MPRRAATLKKTDRSAELSATAQGLLLLDKPAGMTSHDVVQHVRRIYGERSIGHLGTLDPFATGLLVLLLGRATRLATFIDAEPKVYQAGSWVRCSATRSRRSSRAAAAPTFARLPATSDDSLPRRPTSNRSAARAPARSMYVKRPRSRASPRIPRE